MKSPILLVQPRLDELVLKAEDDLIFQLADIIEAEGLHEGVIGHNRLLRCNVSNGDELELLYLRRLQRKEARLALFILNDRIVGEKIERLEVLRGSAELSIKQYY